MKKIFLLWIFLMSVSALFSSCSLFQVQEAVSVDWPEQGLPFMDSAQPAAWDLWWIQADGSTGRERLPADQAAQILLGRESPVVAAAFPVTDTEPYQAYPAGIVSGQLSGTVQLSWKDGFAALCLLELAEQGVPVQIINLNRFQEEISQYSNPWTLDKTKLLDDLVSGDLWVYSFKERTDFDITLELPSGKWYTRYAEDQPMDSDGKWNGTLHTGLYTLISSHGILTLYVTDRGRVLILNGGSKT